VSPADTAPPNTNWWDTFSDPLMTTYIEKATLYNHDLAKAFQRIVESRAFIQVAASSLYPQISDNWNLSRTRFSQNGPFLDFDTLAGGDQPFQVPLPQFPLLQTVFNFAFDATWEFDLFGKIRRRIEEANSLFLASIENRNDLLITLQADVAKTYFSIRKAQKLLILTEKQISLLKQIKEIVTQRALLGLDNNLEEHQVLADLAALEANLPLYQKEELLQLYTLSVLTGAPPECLLQEMVVRKELPKLPLNVEVGLRTDLLRRRPDVRQSEHELHAAVARIGVATAEFFPTFSLAGFFGFQSETLRQFFDWQSRTWTYSENLSRPLFTGGRLYGNLKIEKARASSACEHYKQTVLLALKEAETALTSYTKEKEVKTHLEKSVFETRLVRDLTLERFEKGLIPLKNLLDYERELVLREQTLTESESSALIKLTALYKALGGSLCD
jgi:NodT family efflux transporter outer membrane factor (OMF) lipoprotein